MIELLLIKLLYSLIENMKFLWNKYKNEMPPVPISEESESEQARP